MPAISTGNARAGQADTDTDTDQSDAFRYELGTLNREKILASFDRRDDYARMRYPPRALGPIMPPAAVSANPSLAQWHNFGLTTNDRDLDAEKQDRLHDGQLFRLNRQARGEVIHHPAPSVRPPMRRPEPSLNPILNNPGNKDPMDLARALQFKGNYKAGKVRAPKLDSRPNLAASGAHSYKGPVGRGSNGFVSNGNGSIPNGSERQGTQKAGSLNPHADIHANEGFSNRKKKRASVVRGGKSAVPMRANGAANPHPAINLQLPLEPYSVRGGAPIQQQFSNHPTYPTSKRPGSSMSSASMTSSAMGSSSSDAIFATRRRPPPVHGGLPAGKLASPEEFMAAAKKNGLLGSKHAPKTEDKDDQQKKTETTKAAEPKTTTSQGGGLSASRFSG